MVGVVHVPFGATSGAARGMGRKLTSLYPVATRWLTSADRAALYRHFTSLEMTARRSRFGSALTDDAIAAYVRHVDFGRVSAIAVSDLLIGEIVGVAEAHLDELGRARRAEIAVSLLSPWRRIGLGTAFARQAVAHAFSAGASRADFHFPPDSRAISAVVRALRGRVDAVRGYGWIDRETCEILRFPPIRLVRTDRRSAAWSD